MIKIVIQFQYAFLLISILFILTSNSAFASLTINDAVNVSGKQRMLTQRIFKKIFLWFEIMGRSKSGNYVPSIISKSADKIFMEMNVVTNLYIKAV